MEGITEPVFRELVIDLGGVGAACTEFVRLSAAPLSKRVAMRHLGSAPRALCPVGLQLMASDAELVARSVVAAEAAGAAFIDLNFGCPAPVVFDKCAGSALLAHPGRMAAIVATAVGATGLPVTAKIRAGITDATHLDEVVTAVAESGAAAVCVHGRLRVQGYHQAATWEWIARAVEVAQRVRPGLPVIGNGGVDTATDVPRLRASTGCAAVMVGRAALADPFLFRVAAGGRPGDAAEAARFAVAYADGLRRTCGENRAKARLKQLVKWTRAGDLFAADPDERGRLLRVDSFATLRGWFADRIGIQAGG